MRGGNKGHHGIRGVQGTKFFAAMPGAQHPAIHLVDYSMFGLVGHVVLSLIKYDKNNT